MLTTLSGARKSLSEQPKRVASPFSRDQNVVDRIKFQGGNVASVSDCVFHGLISSFIKNSRVALTQ
jgi:hypothetical protein